MKNYYKIGACILGGIVFVWLGVKILLPVGLPFLLGFLLSKLAAPATKRISQHVRLPYAVISFTCLSLMAAVIVLLFWFLGWMLFQQLEQLAQRVPAFLSSLAQPLSALEKKLLYHAAKLPDGLGVAATQWVEKLFEGSSVVLSSASQWLLGVATRLISKVPDIFLFLLTTVLSAYLFASQAPMLQAFFKKHLPSHWLKKLSSVTLRLKSALAGYLKTQLKLSVVTFGIVTVGLFLLRRNNAIPLALAIALIDALPVFGAGTVLIPWSALTLLSGDRSVALGLLIVYACAALSRAVLEPRILGKQIGLSPLLTLIAMYAGYRLCGFFGMILFPVAAILAKQLYDLIENA